MDSEPLPGISPETFDQFKEEDADDLTTRYRNTVGPLSQYQLRAHDAEDETAGIADEITRAEATIQRMQLHRDQLQLALAIATGAPALPPTPTAAPPADEAPAPRIAKSARIPDPPMFNWSRTTLLQ